MIQNELNDFKKASNGLNIQLKEGKKPVVAALLHRNHCAPKWNTTNNKTSQSSLSHAWLLPPANHGVHPTMTVNSLRAHGFSTACNGKMWAVGIGWDGRGLLLGLLNAAGFHYRLGTSSLQPIYWESENFCQSLRQQLRPSISGPWRSNSWHVPMQKHILGKQIVCVLKFLFPSLQRTC